MRHKYKKHHKVGKKNISEKDSKNFIFIKYSVASNNDIFNCRCILL